MPDWTPKRQSSSRSPGERLYVGVGAVEFLVDADTAKLFASSKERRSVQSGLPPQAEIRQRHAPQCHPTEDPKQDSAVATKPSK
ncbi:hypothetical protein [Mesorhizobium sp. M1E.F.Ca.ET.041.01.1.1]|uniref:hypothetical protein n=1 Tax=Mesorhizobium sp. M1E.F.Ca.ET.041.01.1.1 TaxID=2496759 RepID=UPI001677586A|nr:hypothetical protein [Mesorhizobium sp. M1E.F.Ca.ET.041.01.1.1]